MVNAGWGEAIGRGQQRLDLVGGPLRRWRFVPSNQGVAVGSEPVMSFFWRTLDYTLIT